MLMVKSHLLRTLGVRSLQSRRQHLTIGDGRCLAERRCRLLSLHDLLLLCALCTDLRARLLLAAARARAGRRHALLLWLRLCRVLRVSLLRHCRQVACSDSKR